MVWNSRSVTAPLGHSWKKKKTISRSSMDVEWRLPVWNLCRAIVFQLCWIWSDGQFLPGSSGPYEFPLARWTSARHHSLRMKEDNRFIYFPASINNRCPSIILFIANIDSFARRSSKSNLSLFCLMVYWQISSLLQSFRKSTADVSYIFLRRLRQMTSDILSTDSTKGFYVRRL